MLSNPASEKVEMRPTPNLFTQRPQTSFSRIKRRAILAIFMIFAVAQSTIIFSQSATPADGLKALDGEWIYVEDRTEGRPLEQMGPPMSSTFSFLTTDGAVVLVNGQGGGHKDVRVALDGTATEVLKSDSPARFRGAWNNGIFSLEIEWLRADGTASKHSKKFQVTNEGMLVTVTLGAPYNSTSVALYRHPQDIPMPTPAKATIADLAWLSGDWVGTRGTGGTISMEERWGPPSGGSMFAVSRTISRTRLSAFEYLRILERNGGLVYIAQPNGAAATEFVLTEFTSSRAVFDNPRHDYPKRIVYELSAEGGLSATVGFMKGGSPRKFEYKREEE